MRPECLVSLHYQVKHKQKYEIEVALKPLWDKRWIHIPNRNSVSHKIMPVIPTAFVEDAAGATLVGWLIGKTEYDFCLSLKHNFFECSFFKM